MWNCLFWRFLVEAILQSVEKCRTCGWNANSLCQKNESNSLCQENELTDVNWSVSPDGMNPAREMKEEVGCLRDEKSRERMSEAMGNSTQSANVDREYTVSWGERTTRLSTVTQRVCNGSKRWFEAKEGHIAKICTLDRGSGKGRWPMQCVQKSNDIDPTNLWWTASTILWCILSTQVLHVIKKSLKIVSNSLRSTSRSESFTINRKITHAFLKFCLISFFPFDSYVSFEFSVSRSISRLPASTPKSDHIPLNFVLTPIVFSKSGLILIS